MSLRSPLSSLLLLTLTLHWSPLRAEQVAPQSAPAQPKVGGVSTPTQKSAVRSATPAKRTAVRRTASSSAKPAPHKTAASPASSAAAPAVVAVAQEAQDSEAAPLPKDEQTTPATPRDAVVQLATTLLDTHYHYGGTTPQSGFDCSGLVGYVYREAAGVTLPRSSAAMAQSGERVELDALQPGDLLFFARPQKRVSHVGIYIGEGRFIHAATRANKVMTSEIEQNYLREELVGARRYLTE